MVKLRKAYLQQKGIYPFLPWEKWGSQKPDLLPKVGHLVRFPPQKNKLPGYTLKNFPEKNKLFWISGNQLWWESRIIVNLIQISPQTKILPKVTSKSSKEVTHYSSPLWHCPIIINPLWAHQIKNLSQSQNLRMPSLLPFMLSLIIFLKTHTTINDTSHYCPSHP